MSAGNAKWLFFRALIRSQSQFHELERKKKNEIKKEKPEAKGRGDSVAFEPAKWNGFDFNAGR